MDGIGNTRVVFHYAIVVGLLDDNTCHATCGQFFFKSFAVECTVLGGNEVERNAVEVGVGIYNATYLWVEGLTNEDAGCLLGIAPRHHHRLSSGGSTVVHRSIADVETCQFGNHRLIFKNVVQRALRNLSLIGGIGGQKLAAFDEVLHDAGSVVVVATGTGEADELLGVEWVRQLLEEEAEVSF